MEEIESRKAQAMQQRENDAQQDLELKQTQKIKLILEQEALTKKKEAELERSEQLKKVQLQATNSKVMDLD